MDMLCIFQSQIIFKLTPSRKFTSFLLIRYFQRLFPVFKIVISKRTLKLCVWLHKEHLFIQITMCKSLYLHKKMEVLPLNDFYLHFMDPSYPSSGRDRSGLCWPMFSSAWDQHVFNIADPQGWFSLTAFFLANPQHLQRKAMLSRHKWVAL